MTSSYGAEYDQLVGLMEPGINYLTDNPDLEIAYLDYQRSLLDSEYKGAPNLFTVEGLPTHEQDQLDGIIGSIVTRGLAPQAILEKRLERIRILEVGERTSSVTNKIVGGEYIDGLAIVSARDKEIPGMQNHDRLHEIVHGLAQIVAISHSGDSVFDFGSGLTGLRTTGKGTIAVDQRHALHDIDEAVTDTTTLAVSDVDTADYLAGVYHDKGYYQEDVAFGVLARNDPGLSYAMEEAFFTGIRDKAQSRLFAEAFMSAAPSLYE